MTTTTLARPGAFVAADLLARINQFFTAPRTGGTRTAAELRELADGYEASQPSYAADLRAAADAADALRG